MHTISRKYLYSFQGQSIGSTGWFNIDHEWLKRKFSTLEPDFCGECFEKYIEGQDMEPYKTFFELFDKDIDGQDIKTYKTFVVPYHSMLNDSVTPDK